MHKVLITPTKLGNFSYVKKFFYDSKFCWIRNFFFCIGNSRIISLSFKMKSFVTYLKIMLPSYSIQAFFLIPSRFVVPFYLNKNDRKPLTLF